MGIAMDDKVKRWTAKRKSTLVIEIIQGKPTVSEASRFIISHPLRAGLKSS